MEFHLFNIHHQTGNLLSMQISKANSIMQLDVFDKRVKYFWNKLLDQIKKKKWLNWMNSEIMVKKEIKRVFLGTIEWITQKIWSVYRCINMYTFCAKILFLKVDMER